MPPDINICESIAVKQMEGMVFIEFFHGDRAFYARLDPEQARKMGQAILEASGIAYTGIEPQAKDKPAVTKAERDILVTRVLIVMKNLLSRRKNNKYIAEQLTDIVLSG